MKSSAKTGPNYGAFKSVIEKISQTEISCRYLHQTDFASHDPRSQKIRISKGFCEDNLLLQMVEQNSRGRGITDNAYNSNTCPSRAGRRFLIAYQNQWWLRLQHTPRQSQNHAYNSGKKRMRPKRVHPLINYLDLYLSISNRILNSCSCSSGVFAERNS